jgi:hypothetical protein
MGFERGPCGVMRGYGPDADYPGRAAAELHWRKIMDDLRAKWARCRSIIDEADKNIARRQQEICYWNAKKREAKNEGGYNA